MLEQKLYVLKPINVSLSQKRKERCISKTQLNTDVLIELYGTITVCQFLLHLIVENVKTISDILTVQTMKY